MFSLSVCNKITNPTLFRFPSCDVSTPGCVNQSFKEKIHLSNVTRPGNTLRLWKISCKQGTVWVSVFIFACNSADESGSVLLKLVLLSIKPVYFPADGSCAVPPVSDYCGLKRQPPLDRIGQEMERVQNSCSWDRLSLFEHAESCLDWSQMPWPTLPQEVRRRERSEHDVFKQTT